MENRESSLFFEFEDEIGQKASMIQDECKVFFCPKCKRIPKYNLNPDRTVTVRCKCFVKDESKIDINGDLSFEELTKYSEYTITLRKFIEEAKREKEKHFCCEHSKETRKYCTDCQKWYCINCLIDHDKYRKEDKIITSNGFIVSPFCENSKCKSKGKGKAVGYCNMCNIQLCIECSLFHMSKNHKGSELSHMLNMDKFQELQSLINDINSETQKDDDYYEALIKDLEEKVSLYKKVLSERRNENKDISDFYKIMSYTYLYTKEIPNYYVCQNIKENNFISFYTERKESLENQLKRDFKLEELPSRKESKYNSHNASLNSLRGTTISRELLEKSVKAKLINIPPGMMMNPLPFDLMFPERNSYDAYDFTKNIEKILIEKEVNKSQQMDLLKKYEKKASDLLLNLSKYQNEQMNSFKISNDSELSISEVKLNFSFANILNMGNFQPKILAVFSLGNISKRTSMVNFQNGKIEFSEKFGFGLNNPNIILIVKFYSMADNINEVLMGESKIPLTNLTQNINTTYSTDILFNNTKVGTMDSKITFVTSFKIYCNNKLQETQEEMKKLKEEIKQREQAIDLIPKILNVLGNHGSVNSLPEYFFVPINQPRIQINPKRDFSNDTVKLLNKPREQRENQPSNESNEFNLLDVIGQSLRRGNNPEVNNFDSESNWNKNSSSFKIMEENKEDYNPFSYNDNEGNNPFGRPKSAAISFPNIPKAYSYEVLSKNISLNILKGTVNNQSVEVLIKNTGMDWKYGEAQIIFSPGNMNILADAVTLPAMKFGETKKIHLTLTELLSIPEGEYLVFFIFTVNEEIYGNRIQVKININEAANENQLFTEFRERLGLSENDFSDEKIRIALSKANNNFDLASNYLYDD